MGKHSKNHTTAEADLVVSQILKNKKSTSRWLAFLNAAKVIGAQEEKQGILDEDLNDGIGQEIINYMDVVAPALEEIL